MAAMHRIAVEDDWGGIPINEASRLYALSWQASRLTVKQQQCMGYVAPYT